MSFPVELNSSNALLIDSHALIEVVSETKKPPWQVVFRRLVNPGRFSNRGNSLCARHVTKAVLPV